MIALHLARHTEKTALRIGRTDTVNVIFNYLLIGGKFGFPALGVRGAAIGTIIGQFIIVILSFIAILHPTAYARLEFKKKFNIQD